METPCIHVCSIETGGNHCSGCGRTIEEIGCWTRFTDSERRQIMAILPSRLEQLQQARCVVSNSQITPNGIGNPDEGRNE